MDWTAPTNDDIADLARKTADQFPAAFAHAARAVAIAVDDFADDDTLAAMEIDDPFGLTGLYEGIPLTEKSVMDPQTSPDTVWLFRRPILDEWAARGDVTLAQLVAHVTVHEFAHHFGWSDEDIARIDPWWD